MIEKALGTNKKLNSIENFTVMFWDDKILLGNTSVALGQCITDILNLSQKDLKKMADARNKLVLGMNKLFDPERKKDFNMATGIQKLLNEALDILLNLPPYKYMIPSHWGHNTIASMYVDNPEKFKRAVTLGTQENKNLQRILFKVNSNIEEIIAYQKYIDIMMKYYFERVIKRNTEAYAVAAYYFLSNTDLINDIEKSFGVNLPSFEFIQTRPIGLEYITTQNPDDKTKYMIAERIEFQSVSAFLQVDLFRALMKGYCPRPCHNCGKYFLLLNGYDTKYCNNIAPKQKRSGENKTCRQLGAHNKEQRKDKVADLNKKEYKKVRNRLDKRYSRNTIEFAEYNQLLDLLSNYKDMHKNNEISDHEYIEFLKEL